MKKLGDIIDAVRDGEKPDYEELRYAICAMDALMTFDRMALRKLAEGEKEKRPAVLSFSAMFQLEENFERTKKAMEKDPKEYVGWNNDPDNPEFLQRRGVAKKVMERALRSNNEE